MRIIVIIIMPMIVMIIMTITMGMTLTKFNGSCCVVTISSTGSLFPWLKKIILIISIITAIIVIIIIIIDDLLFTYFLSREAEYMQSQVVGQPLPKNFPNFFSLWPLFAKKCLILGEIVDDVAIILISPSLFMLKKTLTSLSEPTIWTCDKGNFIHIFAANQNSQIKYLKASK